MPKRALDITGPTTMSSERVQKKTERSHEENQERAYIAASRRADRSLEARVQSARMASEIHKKRTGKGFKISEEIVIKEEMYEEEDDDLPRHYRALAAHLHTSSPDMNSRLSAYLTGQVAMASMARQKEVDKLFAESFPNAAKMGQQMAQSVYFQGLQTSAPQPTPSTSNSRHTPQPPTPQGYTDYSRRPSSLSNARLNRSNVSGYMNSPMSQKPSSVDDNLSPPVLSPASGNSDSSHSTPHFTPAEHFQTHVAPQSLMQQSLFTSELPGDAKLLANIDMNDPLAGAFFGIPEASGTAGFDFAPQFTQVPDDASISKQLAMYPPTDYFHGLQPQSKQVVDVAGQGSRIGTPGGGEGDSWESWINEDQWNPVAEQQRWANSEHR